ncbi:MAG: aconitate hydratase AcnA [Meiothermus sp.]|uniref:aconitate hydratase AcnA n=1 Tax=Meiothermus sp. TaxID=1955249 RepID=UPI0025E0590A|nr:aconitate hydratase AcnA [Meiothermus sp.]MCS7057645.1 aconitate hydratase AcnA [Meiothermus sp.]MCS7193997.1 aconitate hydratase AcnA [Meiothermus sp.]MCX7740908.1 aconitate hydratase AcnA [Meiothermus sp.]MDW8090716.1 aconitate hydratase AcnA [Meiothermus sp.]MDW8480857.1 aconitate hydratase AcnA [Meiothermus sp.]
MAYRDDFQTRKSLLTRMGEVYYYDILELERQGIAQVSRLPFSIRVMLESLLRNHDEYKVTREDVINLARWQPDPGEVNVPLILARVILQDFTGVPAVVDLASMRDAVAKLGGDPEIINPTVPVDLVIDHSVQVDFFGTTYAFEKNVELEYQRNAERYRLIKWAQQALKGFRAVPPGTGIVHQVNLEYLAQVVMTQRGEDGRLYAFPDSLVGTDSHTTMINGLGVLGWGVGGIEAEAVMLGQPYYMLAPRVIGFKLYGELPEGATATDLVLRVTEMIRKHGAVGKFVEFYGPGVSKLPLADRATIANMSPEYGATMGFFPIDEETLAYLRLTGRPEELVDLVEKYAKANGLWRSDDAEPVYSEHLELDLSTVVPSLAGPKRPQDRVNLSEVKRSFLEHLTKDPKERGFGLQPEQLNRTVTVRRGREEFELRHGSVVIAAITSCTNTSNPSVMLGAGLLAKKAVEAGLDTQPWVKSSLAPGSKVVTEYLDAAGLTPFLEALRFHTVGYGCTTCIGNSGPLPEEISKAVREGDLVVAAVLSGNRNFEGRVNPDVKANYLASPMLVVAYAIAGRIDIDFTTEPLGYDPNGRPVYLKDIWPSQEEIRQVVHKTLDPEMFRRQYATVFEGDERWKALPAPSGQLYQFDPSSTYIQNPPFFENLGQDRELSDIKGARVLLLLGDSITTDHISPAGSIAKNSPAARYLMGHGVDPADFNSYGSRRGNHEVMMRGTFANIRIRNFMLGGKEGPYTKKLPKSDRGAEPGSGEEMFIYDAAMQYKAEGTPLIVIGGIEYGNGSSRDWAAKGTYLLGVKAVIAQSFERIHRSNLVGMGVLPLQFQPGQSAASLGLTGYEVYDILGIEELAPGKELTVVATRADGSQVRFPVKARIDTLVELDYYKNGGILQTVLKGMLAKKAPV